MRSHLFFILVLKYVEIVQEAENDSRYEVEINESANESDDDTDNGDLSHESDNNACNDSDNELDKNVDDKSRNAFLFCEGEREDLLQNIHLIYSFEHRFTHTLYIFLPDLSTVFEKILA